LGYPDKRVDVYITEMFLTLFCMAGGDLPSVFSKLSLTQACQFKNLKKYVFLGNCISYQLSSGDFLEKSLFHIDLFAFLGLTQKCG
jgi:hypothetical protein